MSDTRPAMAPEIAPFWQALTRVASRRTRAQAVFAQTDSFVHFQFYVHKAFVMLAVTRIFHSAAL
eukprot:5577844-Lingulodinium_polyedra.AAC.1